MADFWEKQLPNYERLFRRIGARYFYREPVAPSEPKRAVGAEIIPKNPAFGGVSGDDEGQLQ